MIKLSYNDIFLISLLLTLLIESIGFVILKRFLLRLGIIRNSEKVLALIPLTSILTLPYLWFVLPSFVHGIEYIIIGEVLVVLIEGLIYKIYTDLDWKGSLTLSLLLNFFSYFLGRELLFLLP